MTDLDKLAELADRVEALAGHDADMDREIWLSVVADDNQRELVQVGRAMHGDEEAAFRLDRMMDGFAPTSSLDAAMSLVPEGYEWGAGSWGNPDTNGPWAWRATRQQSADNDLDYGKGATPALALCAASLRALSIMKVGNTGETGRSSTDGEGAR